MAAVREELAIVRRQCGSREGGVTVRDEKTAPDRERMNDRTKRAEEEVTRARAAIRRARELFDAGDHTAAISSLEAFQPARLVANALAGFRADLQQIGSDAAIPFKRVPIAAPVAVTPSRAVTTTTLPPVRAGRGTRRRTKSVMLMVAVVAAIAAVIWLLLNLR
jgi:hypothetical protein